MTDLFTEAVEERAAIMEHDAKLDRSTAEKLAAADVAKQLHACEVRSVVKMFCEKGRGAVQEFLADVEKNRGTEAMERLRTDALAAVKSKR